MPHPAWVSRAGLPFPCAGAMPMVCCGCPGCASLRCITAVTVATPATRGQMSRFLACHKTGKCAAHWYHKAHHFMRRLLCSSPAHDRPVCEDTCMHWPHQQAGHGQALGMTRAKMNLPGLLAHVKMHRARLIILGCWTESAVQVDQAGAQQAEGRRVAHHVSSADAAWRPPAAPGSSPHAHRLRAAAAPAATTAAAPAEPEDGQPVTCNCRGLPQRAEHWTATVQGTSIKGFPALVRPDSLWRT